VTRLSICRNRCDSCGDCDVWVPGLTEYIASGRTLISKDKLRVDAAAIQRAIDCCPLSALRLEPVT
jgi:ferredoxin